MLFQDKLHKHSLKKEQHYVYSRAVWIYFSNVMAMLKGDGTNRTLFHMADQSEPELLDCGRSEGH